MSQFLLLGRPRTTSAASISGFSARRTDDAYFVTAARHLFGSEDAFLPETLDGTAFEAYFDQADTTSDGICSLVDACAGHFAAIAFFYGDTSDLDKATSLEDLKHIVAEQMRSYPPELYVLWIDEQPST